MTPSRPAAPLGLALLVALSAYAHSGCGSGRTRYLSAPPTAAPAPPPAPPAVARLPLQLVSSHTAETGIGWSAPWEPVAPPGSWRALPSGAWLWVPSAVAAAYELQLIAEVETTAPEAHPLAPPGSIPAGARGPLPGWRLIVLPGPFAAGDRWAVGMCLWDAWHDTTPGTVIWLGWRPGGAASANPRLVPALDHELAHAYSRSWLGEGPPGAP